MLQVGQKAVIHYPQFTDVRRLHRSEKTPRQIVVKMLRDLVEEPLRIEEFRRRPMCNRSRWLIRAYEIGVGYRQFYLGSSAEYESPGHLRIALYNDSERRPEALLGREYAPDLRDRKLMLRLLADWESRDFGGLQLRVLAADMRVVA